MTDGATAPEEARKRAATPDYPEHDVHIDWLREEKFNGRRVRRIPKQRMRAVVVDATNWQVALGRRRDAT